jgi:tRNA A37 threonylcarbamoyladenosine modification protein TsaB
MKDLNIDWAKSDKVLEFLDNFLNLSKIKNPKTEISTIIIHKGEGSFTGLRVGAAIADALSLAWQVPVKVEKTKGH